MINFNFCFLLHLGLGINHYELFYLNKLLIFSKLYVLIVPM